MQVTWANKTCFKKATKMDLQSGGKNWQKTAESNADQNSMDDFIFGFFFDNFVFESYFKSCFKVSKAQYIHRNDC